MFCASNLSVDVEVGRMIQRTTFPIVSGVRGEAATAERN